MIREHLTVAQRLVDAWPGGRPDMAFRCTWHLFAENYLRTVSTTDQARALQRLSEECLDQPEVRLSFGSLWEVTDATLRLDTGSGQGALGVAESHFRAALEGDPNLIEARLRLGRVLYLRNRPDKATAELEQVRAKAKEHYLVYLAALFLGQIHEQANRREQAGECYRAALKLIPDAPAASASLAHLQGTGGPKRRADWALTEAAKPGGVGIVISRTDPWFLYRFGQYWRALERIDRLRALVASADFGR
jgi:tetratricopeptide (TPR) repeat protein